MIIEVMIGFLELTHNNNKKKHIFNLNEGVLLFFIQSQKKASREMKTVNIKHSWLRSNNPRLNHSQKARNTKQEKQ